MSAPLEKKSPGVKPAVTCYMSVCILHSLFVYASVRKSHSFADVATASEERSLRLFSSTQVANGHRVPFFFFFGVFRCRATVCLGRAPVAGLRGRYLPCCCLLFRQAVRVRVRVSMHRKHHPKASISSWGLPPVCRMSGVKVGALCCFPFYFGRVRSDSPKSG